MERQKVSAKEMQIYSEPKGHFRPEKYNNQNKNLRMDSIAKNISQERVSELEHR